MTYRERLAVGGNRDCDTGLSLTGRELVPLGEVSPHPFLWFLAAWGQLMLAAGGLCAVFVTGLSLNVNVWMLYPGIAVLCTAGTLFFITEKLNGYRIYGLIVGCIGYALLLFFTQNRFLSGARQVGVGILRCMKERYGGEFQIPFVEGNAQALTVFLLEIFVLVVLWLAAVIVYRSDALLFNLLLFPFLALMLLVGSRPSGVSLYLTLFGVLALSASARSVRRKRLWGERDSERFRRNLIRHHNIQKKNALLLCGVGVILAVPGFYAVRPLLNRQLAAAEPFTTKVEGQAVGALLELLPVISGGQWNLQAETVGGGVSDGALGDVGGYVLQGLEELKLTCSSKPQETVYLKGYVGSEYTGSQWLAPDAEEFERAAAGWSTEDDPGLYIQNLSFLRKLYAEQEADSSQMRQLKVERINANPNYTYYPYYSYLNSYYKVESGDGSVAGQSGQDDIFSFYLRSDYREEIRAWNEDEDKKSVLDRVEASYAAYVRGHYLTVPEGFEELQKQCDDQKMEPGNVDEINRYIRIFLTRNYSYSMEAPTVPEGEDFIHYFLDESKTGYSIHYASAAVLMFRMFGIPARYVVGYAAPQNLFTAQPDGTYTAVLRDDNSQAWVEVYLEGEGWTPMEMTPGAVGTAEDVEYVGEPISAGQEEEPESDLGTKTELDGNKKDSSPADWWRDPWDFILCLAILLSAGMAAPVIVIGRFYCRRRDYGLDRSKSPGRRVIEIFQAYYRTLNRRGMPESVESTSEEFESWVEKLHPSLKKEDFEFMMRIVLESCYGDAPVTEESVLWMRSVYKGLKRNPFLKKLFPFIEKNG